MGAAESVSVPASAASSPAPPSEAPSHRSASPPTPTRPSTTKPRSSRPTARKSRAREKPPVLSSTRSPPPTTAVGLSKTSVSSSITPVYQLPAHVIRIVDNNNTGDMMLDTNDMRSPEISRAKEIKYTMVRNSQHAKRSKMKKTK